MLFSFGFGKVNMHTVVSRVTTRGRTSALFPNQSMKKRNDKILTVGRWKFVKATRMTFRFLNLAMRWMRILFPEVDNRRKRKCGRRMVSSLCGTS